MTRKDITIVLKAIIQDIKAELQELVGQFGEDVRSWRHDCVLALQEARLALKDLRAGYLTTADFADCDFGMYNPQHFWTGGLPR